mmetsp:Transcript_19478/g.41976  ORF Transcript_19478/g.41976 Transcript_19478/m.41976 type:complete len:200 (-) Transcript_19478:1404-2003(-)
MLVGIDPWMLQSLRRNSTRLVIPRMKSGNSAESKLFSASRKLTRAVAFASSGLIAPVKPQFSMFRAPTFSCPYASGIWPPKLLSANVKTCKLGLSTNVVGSPPLKSLLNTSNTWRAGIVPISSGMLPVRPLEYNHRNSRFTRLDNSALTPPVRLFSEMVRRTKLTQFPTPFKFPVNWFLSKTSKSTAVKSKNRLTGPEN